MSGSDADANGIDALLGSALSGAPSGAVLDRLAALDPTALSPAQRLDLVTAVERHRRWLEGLATVSAAAVDVTGCEEVFAFTDGRGCPGGASCRHDWSGEEIGLALQISPFAGLGRVRRARHVLTALPELAAGLLSGEMSGMHAAMTAEATQSFAKPRVDAVWQRVRAKASSTTPGQFRVLLRKAVVATADPATVLADHARAAREQTGINFRPLEDGLALASIVAPADEMHAFARWADAVGAKPASDNPAPPDEPDVSSGASGGAQAHSDAPAPAPTTETATAGTSAGSGRVPTRGQRQVAALFDTLFGVPEGIRPEVQPDCQDGEFKGGQPGPGQSSAAAQGRRRSVALNLTMSLATWLGLSGEPGDLVGHGPLPAELARVWAAVPESVRVVIFRHADRADVDAVGSRRRFPTAAQRDLIAWRDGTCCWPGCPRPAQDCDVDHVVTFADGGETVTSNLEPLCPRHHAMRHATGWSPVPQVDGTTLWARVGRRSVVRTRPQPPADLLIQDDDYASSTKWLPQSVLASFENCEPPEDENWTPIFEPDDPDPPPD